MFKGRFSKDGKGFIFSDYTKRALMIYMRKNPNTPFEITPKLAESSNQRGWFEGGLCTLVAFYQEGMEHRNYKDVKIVREWLKMEFNSELVGIAGKTHRVAKSTKNELSNGFLERVVDYIVENFNPPDEAMDPNSYKNWHDTIFPMGGPDNYIDYLVKINKLKNMTFKEKEEQDGVENEKKRDDFDSRDDGTNYTLAQDEE